MNDIRNIYFDIQKSPLKVKLLGGVICYAFLTFVLYHFIISKKKSILDAFLLGVCVYGVYDSTTYALLTHFPLYIAIIDTIWGGILFATTTYIYYKIRHPSVLLNR